jgi:peptidoglycan hydrolase-like protein with peptidoglycan-binding domain
MRPTRRRTLPLAVGLAAVVLALAVPSAAAYAARFPTQSLGDRGTDVAAIQGLLAAHDIVIPVDGIFAAATVDAVRSFQAANGLTVDGIVGDTTWLKLIVALNGASTGPAVEALQRELISKRRAPVTMDGVYGVATRAAVRSFQRHAGLPVTSVVNATFWRHLLWHYQYPIFSKSGLCDYTVGNGTADWGTAMAISSITGAARQMVATGRGNVAVGDIGFEHGGAIAGHETHTRGLDVDLRFIRTDRAQCRWGGTYRMAIYDRTATRALIRAIRAIAPGHVKLIYFNDPVLIKEGLTQHYAGHDDHLHVRFCEVRHTDPRYRC